MSEAQRVPCVHCGAEMPPTHVYMSADGAVCPDCQGDAEIEAGFARAYKALAAGAAGAALVSLCFNPFYLFTAMTVASCFATLRFPSRLDPEDRERLRAVIWPLPLALLATLLSIGMAAWKLSVALYLGA